MTYSRRGNMANISVNRLDIAPLSLQNTEYVERKGLGHPDSLIDGIVENVSVKLGEAYVEEAGVILHHNVDKGLIVGGAADVGFGTGKITKPIEIIVAGRAAQEFGGKKIDVDAIAKAATEEYLRAHTRFLDIRTETVIGSKILKGSQDLNGIFSRAQDVPLANDTSFGVGFAPFTETEALVLETERYLNGKDYKASNPSVGEDVKVMGVREGEKITLTIGIAFVSKFINDINEYVKIKESVKNDVIKLAAQKTTKDVEVVINHGDHHEKGDVYITKSGLSCESGDDGAVGRGNRVNGLITPFRNMSLEAAAGKNPVSHIGKIYNIVAREMAGDIVRLYPQIKECNVSIVSQIGRKIDDPRSLYIETKMDKGQSIDQIRTKVTDIASETLQNIGYISREMAQGRFEMF